MINFKNHHVMLRGMGFFIKFGQGDCTDMINLNSIQHKF